MSKLKLIRGAVATAMAPDVTEPLKARMHDEEFWREQDARVAAQRAEEDRERTRAWRSLRGQQLADLGAPKRALEIALGETDPDLDTLAMSALVGWGGGGLRILSGGTGAGKTTAAVWWVAHSGGTRPAFMRAAALEAVSRYDKQVRALWATASSLILDDLGAEYADAKGNFLTTLDEIIDTYHAEKRPLLVTTNLAADAFKARYGSRIVSRARLDNGWIPVGGLDLRSKA